MAKPFLKWAGGKTQLIQDISSQLPQYTTAEDFTYIEPFIGSGAFFFWLTQNFSNMKKAVINDINSDLINTYKSIKGSAEDLIKELSIYQTEYDALSHSEESKKEYYYKKRETFNERNCSPIIQAALFIFLNRTCFNGLYRVNKKGEFNVPMGRYKKPQICNTKNLLNVSKLLQKVEILNGDYRETLAFASKNTLFYLDPPYKPLNMTSSFNAYAAETFDDTEQVHLKEFCDTIASQGASWILSNSDVSQSGDDFFDKLYNEYEILRVEATRRINVLSEKRGKLTELLIMGR